MRRLTTELVALDSTSGREEEVARYWVDHARSRGWEAQLLAVDGPRANVLVQGSSAAPRILFNTHLDTVPEAYGPEEDDVRLYGRGTCDAKGVAAAMLEALEDARDAGAEGLGLLLVVGEERDHIGARVAGADPAMAAPEVLVVGEPTENRCLTAQKGILSARLEATGVEGHSGYPERFDSAVEKLVPALEALRTAPWLHRDSAKGTTVNLSLLRGGDAFNKVPGTAGATLLFRLSEPMAVVKRRAEELLATRAPEARLVWELDAASEPVEHIDALPGCPTGVAAFNTDLPYFGWQPKRRYLLGPGSILQAHRDPVGGDRMRGEWIVKDEQEKGAALYRRLLEQELNA